MGAGEVEVHLTMVVMRGGQVEQVEYATLQPPVAEKVIQAWATWGQSHGREQAGRGGPPAAGGRLGRMGWPAGSARADRWPGVLLSLSVLCGTLAVVLLLW